MRVIAPDQRRIGFWTCLALVVGNTIGIGIFLLPASLAPYGLNTLIGWAVPLLGCLAIAWVLSRLARALPDADGPYGYIRHTLGDLPAFVAMWAYWVAAWLTNAALATGVVGYLMVLVPAARAVPPVVLALALIWPMALLNLLRVRVAGGVQIVTTALKLLPMLAIVLLGAWILVSAPATYAAHLPTTPVTLHGVAAASAIALYAMLGFETGSVPAARVENPGRTIPRATMIGTVLLAVVYLLVSTVPLLLVRQSELAAADAPFSLVIGRFMGADSGRWLALFVVISGVGCLNGWTFLTGELTRTMAANGTMPAVFARANRFGAPAIALLATGAFASVVVVMSYSRSLVGAFTLITLAVTVATLPLYLGCALALLALWRRRAAGGWILPVAAVGILFVIFAFIGAGVEPFLLALALTGVGLAWYTVMRSRRRTVATGAPGLDGVESPARVPGKRE